MTLPNDPTLRVCQAVRLLRHLAPNLPSPLSIAFNPVPASHLETCERLVSQAFAACGVQPLRFCHDAPEQLSSFELLISRRLSKALPSGPVDTGPHSERLIAEFDFSPPPAGLQACVIDSFDGAPLNAYSGGEPGLPALLLALPCGLPFELCQDWVQGLAQQYRVLTWETRGLFGGAEDFDSLAVDTDAQVADLFAVMDHFDQPDAHLMGICGGAMIALCAAASQPARVRSLSLWHGDYTLGEDDWRTPHQRNFEWLMEAAAGDREEARELQKLFVDPATLMTTPEPIAHLALYPYTNAELFYRYARLNHALNQTDLHAVLPSIEVPALVVAGDNDQTTHIGGSKHVARTLPQARLHIEQGGSHVAFFEHGRRSLPVAFGFMEALLAAA
ncbi:alpha/beta hydrolase [Pseudomonas sp. DTU_2021_1001937_2_SI_NGA_ILE_001]|uniref:alpha/beta fold hydrolase n=1 Tax=Pseudomonas sp. DTU_2021_1001937_2_SI_NGA_ILE_001 TaxID=3077589 RepID=UPI0028FC26FD|nr:alpha/beta hydrolase [Pseudomonas sp. DTU_2021_1001937_2_SI_NGA_ILE_001]WNW10384.1 alpha/beta hydrolase [Pseudomonas sp. DTU_2021_1001937_2_SI_NGA_ILE_001]